jgi:GT2 family glycosyltransferase
VGQGPRPGLSIVICTRDRPDKLRTCLSAVVEHLGDTDELIVVDSASRSPDTMTVVRETQRAQGIRCDTPGLSHARNAGVATAKHDVVVFTDDDCAPDAHWLDALSREFADPTVGAVTGSVRPVGQGFSSALTSPERTVFRYPTRGEPIGHGANMAMRRALLVDIGGFDERLGAGAQLRSADDWDVFFRVLRRGYRIVYTPESTIRHEQWRSSREALTTRYGYALGGAALATKLARLGGPDDRAQSRVLTRKRLREGGTAVLRGIVTLKWFRLAAGVATLAGQLRGTVSGRRSRVSGEVFAGGPVR